MENAPGFTPPSGKPPASGLNSSPVASLTPGAVTDDGTPNAPSSTETTPAAAIKKPNFTPIENKKPTEGWNGAEWTLEDVSYNICKLNVFQ